MSKGSTPRSGIMGFVDPGTIVTSAGVAAVVTLAIEYAAKPHLEVRKERILHVSRGRQQLLSTLVATQVAVHLLASSDRRPELIGSPADIEARWIELKGLERELLRATTEMSIALDLRLREMLTSVSAAVAVAGSRRSVPKGLTANGHEYEAMGLSMDMLSTSPRTRTGRRVRAAVDRWVFKEAELTAEHERSTQVAAERS